MIPKKRLSDGAFITRAKYPSGKCNCGKNVALDEKIVISKKYSKFMRVRWVSSHLLCFLKKQKILLKENIDANTPKLIIEDLENNIKILEGEKNVI